MSIEFEITRESITKFRKKYGKWIIVLIVIYLIHPFEGFYACYQRTQSNWILTSIFSSGALDDFCEKKTWRF